MGSAWGPTITSPSRSSFRCSSPASAPWRGAHSPPSPRFCTSPTSSSTRPNVARWRGERLLDLTPKEFGALELLLASQGRTISAEELLARVWDENADPFTNAVKITISRLRAKLGDPPVIETVAKSGYRI